MTRPADASRPRFLVIQYGARHGYAIPAAFHRAGTLDGVYTDLTAAHGLGRVLARAAAGGGAGGGGPFAKALSRRLPPHEIAAHIQTSGAAWLAAKAVRATVKGPRGTAIATRLAKSLAERQMVARGTGEATHLYTMLGEGGRFVRQARAAGLKTVGDVYIALSADPIVAEEVRRFPDWGEAAPNHSRAAAQAGRNATLLACDLLVCPSDFVRDDLVAHHGVAAGRTLVVPYAVSPRWLSLRAAPEPGRVLFAGSANVRKGIHHLAAAATRLKGLAKVRVAGGVSARVRAHPDARDLTFLGHLGPGEMEAEFAAADVFAFPSLAEGAASVTAEALGAGVPVVTTKAAGSIVRDGIDGIIVPERDPEALAEAVRTIVQDRDRREAMSLAARERAQSFTWDGFAATVIEAARHLS